MTKETIIMIVGDNVDDEGDQNDNNTKINDDNAVEHSCGKLDPGDGYDTWGMPRIRILTSACKAHSLHKSLLGALGIHLGIHPLNLYQLVPMSQLPNKVHISPTCLLSPFYF